MTTKQLSLVYSLTSSSRANDDQMPNQTPNEEGQDSGCTADAVIHLFRPLGGFAPVAVNSGLRPETR